MGVATIQMDGRSLVRLDLLDTSKRTGVVALGLIN
jgi:hypothetical protein